jgi:hypothetical protein
VIEILIGLAIGAPLGAFAYFHYRRFRQMLANGQAAFEYLLNQQRASVVPMPPPPSAPKEGTP